MDMYIVIVFEEYPWVIFAIIFLYSTEHIEVSPKKYKPPEW